MSRCLQLFLLGLCVTVMDGAPSPLYAQGAYPRVMSPTGRFYGPTQAHYQYERQYGRPWHGGPAQFNPNTGVNINVGGAWGGWGGVPGYGGFYPGYLPYGGYGYHVQRQGFPLLGGYGYGFGAPVYGGYSVYQEPIGPRGPQGMLPMFGPAPNFAWQQPDPLQQQQFQIPQQRQPGNGFPQQQQNPAGPAQPPEPIMAQPHNFMPPAPTTLAQRQRSAHLQGQGDVWFRQQNFLQAYSRYKQAAAAAPDQAAPRFRMAYAFMSMQRFELAVPEFQRGVRIDPKYVVTGEGPTQIYGEENRLAAAALPQAVAAWVRQDIRSADRLFLLGTLLMINGDQVRARVLLQTALDFGGPAEIIVPLLKIEDLPSGPAKQPPAVNQGGNQGGLDPDNRPPVPEEVEEMLKDGRNFLAPVTPKAPPARQPRGSGLPPVVPPAAPANPPQPIGPALPEPPAADPGTDPAAAEALKPTPAVPGFQPIPKKGAAAQPVPPKSTPEPAATDAQTDVQPAAGEASGKSEGPVIPIPGASN